jgi:hypothetical protein
MCVENFSKNIKFVLDDSILSNLKSAEEERRAMFVKNTTSGNNYSNNEDQGGGGGGGGDQGGGGGGGQGSGAGDGGGKPSGKGGSGCKALTPNLSSIPDNQLDIVKGPFTANGNVIVNELIVIDGKPVGKDVGRAFLLMRRAAIADKITGMSINSGFRSPYTSIDKISTKGTQVSAQSQQSLFSAFLKGKGNLAAAPGDSNHGRSFALDINVGSKSAKSQPPLNKSMYQWLIKNAYKFGLVRYVAVEEWHWEYRPGEYQYNALVPYDNPRYKGFDLDCDCITG